MSIRERCTHIFGILCPRHIWVLIGRLFIVVMLLLVGWTWLGGKGKSRTSWPGGPCGAIVREGDSLRLYTMYDDGIEEAFESDDYMAILY